MQYGIKGACCTAGNKIPCFAVEILFRSATCLDQILLHGRPLSCMYSARLHTHHSRSLMQQRQPREYQALQCDICLPVEWHDDPEHEDKHNARMKDSGHW